ncbi:MAG: hypothetical protein FVQ80_16760 [Planctomycetes bacterium]|nr:hypothetical protein [Planctomycetota bacterium]
MKSESRIELRKIFITDINLEVHTPYTPEEDNTFTIELESTWSLSDNKKTYISFPMYTFEATSKKTDEKCLTASIMYFCVVDRSGETLAEINDAVIAELRQSSETIVLHHFVKDLNDLLARAGYPLIHFSSLSAALEGSI